jgi:inosose dehydratase
MTISRRSFVASVAAGVAAWRLPPILARRLQVGHTGITWGYAPANAETAIRDVGSLGYHAFESFGSVLDWWETRGGLGRLLEAAKLPLRSAYCPFELTNAAVRREEVAKATRWGALIKKYGGSIAVVGPNSVPRSSYVFSDNRAAILATLNDIGRALQDVGIVGAIHPHSGSCVQTRDEVMAVMSGIDTTRIGLAPDVGELMAGGADPVQVVRELLPLVRHVHLKDYDGGSKHDGFCPLGQGRVELSRVVELLESAEQEMMLMVELNPGTTAALETARTSKSYLGTLGYGFR